MIGPHDEREVRKHGPIEPQRVGQQQLTRRVRQMILASDHVRDLHQRIVYDDRKVVGRPAVGPEDHGVADHLPREADGAAHDVIERDLLDLRDAKPDRGRLAGRSRRRTTSGARSRQVPGYTAG